MTGSGSWLDAGAGFTPAPSSRSTPSASASRRILTTSKAPVQTRLFHLGKTALVTPPATSSRPKPTQKQSKLSADAFTRKPTAPKENRPSVASSSRTFKVDKGKRRAVDDSTSSSTDNHDPAISSTSSTSSKRRLANIASVFSRNSPSASTSTSSPSSHARTPRPHNVAHSIINPSRSQRRPRPTLCFSDDDSLPLDDAEMDGEDARRKRRREDRGGFGKLELCDSDAHGGFHSGIQGRAKATMKRIEKEELEMSSEQEYDESAGRDKKPSRRDSSVEIVAQDVPHLEEDEDLAEPSTIGSSYYATAPHLRIRPSPARSPSPQLPQRSHRSYTNSSQSSDSTSTSEALQAQLVPLKQQPSRPPRVLVPDSDELGPPSDVDDLGDNEEGEAELEALVQKLGEKGAKADDSGFAEAEDMDVDESEPATIYTGPKSPSPVVYPAPPLAEDQDDEDLPNSQPTIPPLTVDLCAASSSPPPPASSAHRSLGRTPSGILMPPPLVPNSSTRLRRLRRGAPSSRSPQPRVLVEDTQPGAVPVRFAVPPELTIPGRIVLCDETQYPPPPVMPLEQLLELASDDLVLPEPRPLERPLPPSSQPLPEMEMEDEDLELALALPIPPTVPLPADVDSAPEALPPLPRPQPTQAPWTAALASVWKGQRPASPPSSSVRQARLNEFFHPVPVPAAAVPALPDDDDERELELELVIADSQRSPYETGWELATPFEIRQAYRTSRTGLAAFTRPQREQDEDEDEDVEDADEVEVEVVDDSDPEDDAPVLVGARAGGGSPLGTPVRARFPRYSPGKLRAALMRRSAAVGGVEAEKEEGEGEAVQEQDKEKEKEKDQGEGEAETQWESYWSYPSSTDPSPPPPPPPPQPRLDAPAAEEEVLVPTASQRCNWQLLQELVQAAPSDSLPPGWIEGDDGKLVRVGLLEADDDDDEEGW
ncbi:hypothetical protein JCM5296_002010 [Sporobolomyces johnsonii]